MKVHEGIIIYEIKYWMEHNGAMYIKASRLHRINAITGKIIDNNVGAYPVDDSDLTYFAEVPKGQFTMDDGDRAIAEKYGVKEDTPGEYVSCDSSRVNKNGGITFTYSVRKDGFDYKVAFYTESGKIIELSKTPMSDVNYLRVG